MIEYGNASCKNAEAIGVDAREASVTTTWKTEREENKMKKKINSLMCMKENQMPIKRMFLSFQTTIVEK